VAYLPSIIVLGIAILLALRFASTQDFSNAEVSTRDSASLWLSVATFVQAIHFVEEWQTGFTESLSEVFNVPPMPDWFFISFNLAWIVAWGLSIRGLRRGYRAALFASWFLAIAGVANGVLHPMLSVLTSGYFPGLITAPAVGLICLVLIRRLRALAVG